MFVVDAKGDGGGVQEQPGLLLVHLLPETLHAALTLRCFLHKDTDRKRDCLNLADCWNVLIKVKESKTQSTAVQHPKQSQSFPDWDSETCISPLTHLRSWHIQKTLIFLDSVWLTKWGSRCKVGGGWLGGWYGLTLRALALDVGFLV